jgi:hypothetical protein
MSDNAPPSVAGVAMVGMPDGGKSTYLAALYHLLTEDLPDLPAQLLRQPTQRVYLEAIRSSWLKGEPFGRTSKDDGELVELALNVDGRVVNLQVPDIAGECFRDVVVRREVDSRVEQIVQAARGLILFTHPDHQRPRVLIGEAKELAELAGETFDAGMPASFEPLLIPGEVHLVELLQWISDIRSDRNPIPVALVVSAWDRSEGMSPNAWLASKMPMLQQYLDGHREDFAVAVFGVSAQGGEYGAGVDLSAVRGYERAYVEDGEGSRSHDLTAPLRWAVLE